MNWLYDHSSKILTMCSLHPLWSSNKYCPVSTVLRLKINMKVVDIKYIVKYDIRISISKQSIQTKNNAVYKI